MNKQEAIKTIEKMGEYGRFVDEPISKKSVLNIINQIDEPQKTVIPKLVAEWIERCKENNDTLYHALQDNDDVNDWLDRDDNEDLFARAWVSGYEVEKEKLYTVEIPNPNDKQLALKIKRLRADKLVIAIDHTTNPITREYMVTESEIKQDFDWAWRWAKPVEEER